MKDNCDEAMAHIRMTLEGMVGDPSTFESRQEAVNKLTTYLEGRNLKVSNIEIKEVFHTWKSLYPDIKTRCLAWLAYKSRLPAQTTKLRWYHLVFPYSVHNGEEGYVAELPLPKVMHEITFDFIPTAPSPEVMPSK